MNTPALPVLARRSLLAALTFAPAAVALPTLARPHPDAELLEVARQHEIARLAADRLSRVAAEREAAALAVMPPPPEALTVRDDDWFSSRWCVGKPFTADQVQRWRDRLNTGVHRELMTPATAERFERRGREVVAAFDAYGAQTEAAMFAGGVRQAYALAEAAGRAQWDLEQRLFALKATTPAGLKAKGALVALTLGEPDGTYEDHVTHNLLADLLAAGA